MAAIFFLGSCKPDTPITPTSPQVPTLPEVAATPLEEINDTYGSLAAFEKHRQWGPYNLHDPALIQDEDGTYYSYSTDVMYGLPIMRAGVQIRSSKDLVAWKFEGWALPGLPKNASDYIRSQGSEPFENVWAPYMIKVGSEYRLYYSLSSAVHKLSAIGLATAETPLGPFIEKGLAVTSATSIPMTNAIDPSVIIDQSGRHWMYYGSAYDGIYVMELDATTGLAKTFNDKGFRIAQRGFTGNRINGNIEAPEVIYHPEFGKYYLFLAYDWLESKYNVRVGRSDQPDGPFVDYSGRDMNESQDDAPMILAPYAFQGHQGWQGVSHCAVIESGGKYFMAHQGRPVEDRFMMVMHVREIYWTEDGWPLVSPQRYAATPQSPVEQNELFGNWEQIVLNYRVVPGYADEQTIPDLQFATTMQLDASGTIDGNADHAWTYTAPWLSLSWDQGAQTAKVHVARERDWEKKVESLIFTGLTDDATAIWGKKSP